MCYFEKSGLCFSFIYFMMSFEILVILILIFHYDLLLQGMRENLIRSFKLSHAAFDAATFRDFHKKVIISSTATVL